MIAPKNNGNPTLRSRPDSPNRQAVKPPAPVPLTTNRVEDELTMLKAVRAKLQMILLSAHHELVRAKQIRAAAERYQQETETKARSQAQMLILQARLANRREIAELKRKSCDEIKTMMTDLRGLRQAAMAELEAQQKFTDAARIKALSLGFLKKGGGMLADKEKTMASSHCGEASKTEH